MILTLLLAFNIDNFYTSVLVLKETPKGDNRNKFPAL